MRRDGGRRWFVASDIVMFVVSIATLLTCIFYLASLTRVPNFSDLSLDPQTWKVLSVSDCQGDGKGSRCLEVGDRVVSLGGMDFSAYLADWNAYLYRGLSKDGRLNVLAERDGESFEVTLEPSRRDAYTLVGYWAIPMVLWIVGTAVILLVRPRNMSWLILILLFYSTAVWISAGLVSSFHLAGSTYVYHVFVWFFLPFLVHAHLSVPYPILPKAGRWLMASLYLAAIILLMRDLRGLVSPRVAMAWVGIAIVATFSLIAFRLLRSSGSTQRLVDRVLLFGVVIGLLPLVCFAALSMLAADSEARQFFMTIARYLLAIILPIWPISYLYALLKFSPGPIELRANRLLGTYGFFCLFVTAFVTLYSLGDFWLPSTSSRAPLALVLALVFVVVAPTLKRHFQKFVDRSIYGIQYLPEEIIGVFAARIPRAFDFPNLRRILVGEVTPTLMIRESALYVWDDEGRVDEIYRSGYGTAVPDPVAEEAMQGWMELESPTETALDPATPDWVRLAVPLHGRERTLGVWLLGRRDPDDLYPRTDRELLHNIANQIAPVVENVRLVERARQEVEENRRLQQQLIHSQKMEAIGRLSAGVAHDFNNLLSVILGYCSLLAVKYRGDETLTGYLDDIRDAGDRAAALTRQLLAFSRQQVMEAKPFQLNDVVMDVEHMLQRLTGEDVEVVVRLADDLALVRIDSAQMGQVVMNLAVNARDAMPSGGTFELRTDFVRLREALENPIQGEIPARDYVVLTVTDTGVGMPEDQLHRIFEPYFTTKELGKGTGLGLSMVYGIVSQFKGYIRVASHEGSGTTFTIYLPALSSDESSVAICAPLTGEAAGRGTETILLVEDEDSVRHVACEILESRGYYVVTAADGIEAIQVYNLLERRLDLLLTDVVMPQMKGTELAVHLRLEQPDLPVLFMSGYNEESVFSGWRGEFDERPQLIGKPFSPANLVARIRHLLDPIEATRKVEILGNPARRM